VRRTLVLAAAAVIALIPTLAGCNPDKTAATSSTNGMIANLNGGGFTSNPNPQRIFNPFLPQSTLTTSYTFEPLFIQSGYNCAATPWLGTSYKWTDSTHLTVTTRSGVKWSDGTPFTAQDVAFTFNMLHRVPAFDQLGIWQELASVQAEGDNKVIFTTKAPSSEVFSKIASIVIVPQHIWGKVADPLKFTNPNPVGTGPFLYGSFNTQELILKRNPNYWRANQVKVEQLTFHNNGGGGDTDKLRLAEGQYDWNAMFVADISKTYVDRDPQHNKYWFNPGADISLYMNLTQAPFNDLKFRQAIAYAINRQEIAQRAEYGYVQPASQTGLLLPGEQSWLSPSYANGDVYPFDPAKAKSMFQAAGYKYSGGKLLGKDGKPMHFTFEVESGWLDWIQAANIIKSNLSQVGIDISVVTANPTDVQNDEDLGHFQMQFGTNGGQCDMYQNFDQPLGSDKTAPIGKPAVPAGAGGNFVRWHDANTDNLLNQLKVTTDPTKQKQLVAGLEDVMVRQMPIIPLWYGAQWFEYRTTSAVGWPSQSDPYATMLAVPSNGLVVMTKLRPPKN
jgi:peptide/nickel transport system substrate-binding protein